MGLTKTRFVCRDIPGVVTLTAYNFWSTGSNEMIKDVTSVLRKGENGGMAIFIISLNFKIDVSSSIQPFHTFN